MTAADRSALPPAASPPGARRWLRRAGLFLPLLVLAAVLARLDLPHLSQLLSRARWGLVLMALPLGLLVVASGALRYRALAIHFGLPMHNLGLALSEYWRSLALGLLAPGSLGSDVYRVMAALRRTGRALPAASAVVTEKVVALLACAAMAGAALPLAAPAGMRLWNTDARWVLLTLGLSLATLSWALPRTWRWLQTAARLHRPRSALAAFARRLVQRAGARGAVPARRMPQSAEPEAPPPAMLAGTLLQALVWSGAALALSALQAHLFFAALGSPVPLAVNLLVAPLLFVTLALPFSVGGVGVRELAFIAFYGACGVAVEPALVVSTFSLCSQLLAHGLGATWIGGKPDQPLRSPT